MRDDDLVCSIVSVHDLAEIFWFFTLSNSERGKGRVVEYQLVDSHSPHLLEYDLPASPLSQVGD